MLFYLKCFFQEIISLGRQLCYVTRQISPMKSFLPRLFYYGGFKTSLANSHLLIPFSTTFLKPHVYTLTKLFSTSEKQQVFLLRRRPRNNLPPPYHEVEKTFSLLLCSRGKGTTFLSCGTFHSTPSTKTHSTGKFTSLKYPVTLEKDKFQIS